MRTRARMVSVGVVLALIVFVGWLAFLGVIAVTTVYPCVFSRAPLTENAMAQGNVPPDWSKEHVVKLFRQHLIRYRENGTSVMTNQCGIDWLGMQWW